MNSHGPILNKRCKYKFNIQNINLTKYQKGGNYTGIKLLIYLPSTIKSVYHIIVFKPPFIKRVAFLSLLICWCIYLFIFIHVVTYVTLDLSNPLKIVPFHATKSSRASRSISAPDGGDWSSSSCPNCFTTKQEPIGQEKQHVLEPVSTFWRELSWPYEDG